jgi:hypothetical protein
MAAKISELPAGSALAGTEATAIVQAAATVQVPTSYYKTLALEDFSANALTFVAAADFSAMRAALGVAIGTDVPAYSANLAGLSSLATLGLISRTGAGTFTTYTLDTDTALTANSDSRIASQKATKAYVDAAVGGAVSDGDKGDITVSSSGTVWTVDSNTISDAKLRQSAGLSVVARSANSTGNVADVTAANDGEVLRRSGTALGFGTIATAGIANSAVTLAKIANASANSKLLGSGAAGSGSAYTELSLGTGLSFSGTTLNVSGFATTGAISGSGLTMSTARLLGRTTASSGAVEEITVSTGLTFSATTLAVDTGTSGAKVPLLNGANTHSGLATFSAGADITPASTPSTTAVGYLGSPQNTQNGAYTTVMSDAGKHLYHTSGSAHTWTIDSNANVAYPIGTILTFINESGGGVVTLAITSDTLRWGSSTGSRSLAANGTATAIKVASTTWRLTGDGIT